PFYFFFFFSSRRRHTRFSRDWSSDVCSSDLIEGNVSYMINKSANKSVRSTFKFLDQNGKPATIWANSVEASQGVSESQITARARSEERRVGKECRSRW